MKLVKMVRTSPEIPGGPTSLRVQKHDIDALKARGYVQEGEEFEIDDPKPSKPETDEKPTLVAKALELELGTEEELNALSIEDLAKLIEDNSDDGGNSDTNSEKAALVAKALELKTAHPKAVNASPSSIPNMSIKKLTKLIEDSEAAIAAGNQE
jgi:hypothetical protein